MADSDFPVPRGHTETTIRQVLKLIRKEILISGKRKAQRKADKETTELSEEEASDSDDSEPAFVPGRRVKMAKTS